MLGSNPYAKYREMQVTTATPGQLLLMLYDGAIRFLREAEEALKGGRLEDGHRLLLKAEDVVAELMSTLNFEAGPIAQNLYRLYDYMQRRLIEANVKKDASLVQEVAELLSGLREAWGQAVQAAGAGRTAGGEK
ncbi:MAG: flagellar secretion chaperone FliS [Bacillota bacterium]|nr:flagellar secretion chaperone FliS [Bacillota bacterium]MDK2925312.1 flagellar secretion chaperone FliS [Bacillota bacterium]